MVKFGTGGWRAIIGEEFTKENIQKLTLAICLKMKAEHGYRSSPASPRQ